MDRTIMERIYFFRILIAVIGLVPCVSAQSSRFFITAPNVFRVGVEETVVVSLLQPDNLAVDVELYLRLPGTTRNLVTRTVRAQEGAPVKATLSLAADVAGLPQTGESLDLGARSLDANHPFEKVEQVLVTHQSGYVFVQTDKPIYNPDQTVQIRVISLDQNMLPSDRQVHVDIINPAGTIVQRLRDTQAAASGFISGDYMFPTHVRYGKWLVSACYGPEYILNSTTLFEVRGYELSTHKFVLHSGSGRRRRRRRDETMDHQAVGVARCLTPRIRHCLRTKPVLTRKLNDRNWKCIKRTGVIGTECNLPNPLRLEHRRCCDQAVNSSLTTSQEGTTTQPDMSHLTTSEPAIEEGTMSETVPQLVTCESSKYDPKFRVHVTPPKYILREQNSTVTHIRAHYLFGKPVIGKCVLRVGVVLDDGTVEYSLVQMEGLLNSTGETTINLTNLTDVFGRANWFDLYEGNKFHTEAIVIDTRSGFCGTAISQSTIITSSPYILDGSRTVKYFRPALTLLVKLDLTFVNGDPAPGVPVQVTANATLTDGGQLQLQRNMYDGNGQVRRETTDRNGGITVLFSVPANADAIRIDSITEDPNFTANQASFSFDIAKSHSPVDAGDIVIIPRPESSLAYKPIVGQQMAFVIQRSGFNGVVDIHYMFVTAGKVVSDGVLPNEGNNPVLAVVASPDMVPTTRVIIYYITPGGDVVADSLSVDVEKVCTGEVFLRVLPERRPPLPPHYPPNQQVQVEVTAPPLSHVGILGIDKAVSPQGQKNFLTRQKMFDRMKDYDPSCGPGGGRNTDEIFRNSGLTVLSNTNLDVSPRQDIECYDSKRSRRSTSGQQLEIALDTPYRDDFRETWFFDMVQIPANEQETFVYDVSTPGSITEWQMTAVSVSPTLGMCVADTTSITVFQNFFIKLHLPYSVVKLEQTQVVVTIFNYGLVAMEVTVILDAPEQLCISASATNRRVYVTPQNASSTTFVVRPVQVGEFEITVLAGPGQTALDVVKKKLKVVSSGIKKRVTRSMTFNPGHIHFSDESSSTGVLTGIGTKYEERFNITIREPEKSIPGSASCTLRLTATDFMPGTIFDEPINADERPVGRNIDVNITIVSDLSQHPILRHHFNNYNFNIQQEIEIDVAIGYPITVVTSGSGVVLGKMEWQYNIEEDDHDDLEWCPFDINITANEVTELDRVLSVDINVCVRYKWKHRTTQKSIIDVGLYSGFRAVRADLETIVNSRDLVSSYKVTDRSVVFYLDRIPNDEDLCFSFEARVDAVMGKVQPSPVHVYDYYNPDESCSVFYTPGEESPLINTLCIEHECTCLADTCGMCGQDNSADQLQAAACASQEAYALKIRVDRTNSIGGFDILNFTVLAPIKTGVDPVVGLEKRQLYVNAACSCPRFRTGRIYLLVGDTGIKSTMASGQEGLTYVADGSTKVEYWPATRKRKNAARFDKLINFQTDMTMNGCHL